MSKDKLKEKFIEVLKSEAMRYLTQFNLKEAQVYAHRFTGNDEKGNDLELEIVELMALFHIHMRTESPGADAIPAKITPPRFKDNYRMDCEWPGVKFGIEFDEAAKGLRISKEVHKFEGSISIDVEGINQILIT